MALSLGLLIIILFVSIFIIVLKEEKNINHSEYGEILTYSLKEDNWESFVSYSEPQEKTVIYRINKVSDYSELTKRFNEFLDKNPSYYLNDDFFITVVFDFELKNRGPAMQIRNFEKNSGIRSNHLYVASIGEWDLITHGIYKGKPLENIECIEIGRSDLDNYYIVLLNVFPSLQKIVTVTSNTINDEKIISYALSVGRIITIEITDNNG